MCVLLYYYYKTSSLQACYPHTITLIIHLFLTIQCYRVSINTATTNTTWSSSCILYIQIQIYVIYTTTKSTEHCLQQHCISNINYVDQSVFWHIVFSMVFYLLHEQNKSTMSFSHLVAIIIMSYLNFWDPVAIPVGMELILHKQFSFWTFQSLSKITNTTNKSG